MNQPITLVEELVEETHRLVNIGRQVVLKVAENVWRIRNEKFADKPHADFVSFIKGEFGIGGSMVSKSEKIGDGFYAHGYKPDDFLIEDTYKDFELVYTAAKMPGSPEERFSQVKTLERPDVRRNAADIDKHVPDYKLVCVKPGCWLPQESHPEYAQEVRTEA